MPDEDKATLLPRERARLAGVLSLLGSPIPGERDAAALAADRMVRGRGYDWHDLLAPTAAPRPAPPPQYEAPPRGSDWRTLVAVATRRPDLLSAWEGRFLASLARRRTVITAKQRGVLVRLAERAQTADAARWER
jgi:hypothetical protein